MVKMNKKGQGDILGGKTIYYIIYIFIFVICIAIASLYINNKVMTDIDFSELESDVIGSITFNCFGGSEFGIIDHTKFNDENIKNCFNKDMYHVKAKLDFFDDHLVDMPIKNFNFDSENKVEYYVLVDYNDRLEKANLVLEFENVA